MSRHIYSLIKSRGHISLAKNLDLLRTFVQKVGKCLNFNVNSMLISVKYLVASLFLFFSKIIFLFFSKYSQPKNQRTKEQTNNHNQRTTEAYALLESIGMDSKPKTKENQRTNLLRKLALDYIVDFFSFYGSNIGSTLRDNFRSYYERNN